jgi:hypothetical protein
MIQNPNLCIWMINTTFKATSHITFLIFKHWLHANIRALWASHFRSGQIGWGLQWVAHPRWTSTYTGYLHLLECGHSLGPVFTCTKPIVFLAKNLDHFNECESTIFHDAFWYCHMRSEIIQIVSCDNYDGFQHLSFIFPWKFTSLF